MFLQQAFLQLKIFAIHNKNFLWNTNLIKVCVNWITIRKKVIEGETSDWVLAFWAYMFESSQSFNNSPVKSHFMFSMSNLQLLCQNCRTSASATKLQSLLKGQLNRYRYIFDISRLPYSVACITLPIVLTKTLPYIYIYIYIYIYVSLHCHFREHILFSIL